MAAATEVVAKECEASCLVWNKAHSLDDIGFDVGSQTKFRELESMLAVATGQFQPHRHAFLHRDFARLEFESGCGNANDLFVVRRCRYLEFLDLVGSLRSLGFD